MLLNRETVVFKAAVSWAVAECQRRGIEVGGKEVSKSERSKKCREVLESALYLIRFPAMTVQEFADTVATSGLLTLQVRENSIPNKLVQFSGKKCSAC